MKSYLLAATFILFAGCSTHNYRISADRVNLYLRIPDAKTVYFASSLDRFRLHQIKKNDNGVWEVVVPSVREFSYFYTIDGSIYVPDCELKEKDDFGAQNCIFEPNQQH